MPFTGETNWVIGKSMAPQVGGVGISPKGQGGVAEHLWKLASLRSG